MIIFIPILKVKTKLATVLFYFILMIYMTMLSEIIIFGIQRTLVYW